LCAETILWCVRHSAILLSVQHILHDVSRDVDNDYQKINDDKPGMLVNGEWRAEVFFPLCFSFSLLLCLTYFCRCALYAVHDAPTYPSFRDAQDKNDFALLGA